MSTVHQTLLLPCFVLSYILLRLYFSYFFFFKQKTAYEMRISDWSSDVCSSDLSAPAPRALTHRPARPRRPPGRCSPPWPAGRPPGREIGRASCRERVCQYV